MQCLGNGSSTFVSNDRRWRGSPSLCRGASHPTKPMIQNFNNRKRWRVHRPDPAQAEALARALRVSVPVASVYVSRGLDSLEKVECFCTGSGIEYDPCLLPDMDAAVDRIVFAYDHGESVLVEGDGDVDGLTSAAVLARSLQASTGLDPFVHVPSRLTEGFGVSTTSIERAYRAGAKLIISCDTSPTSDAADRARALGIDIVVADHHQPKETDESAYAAFVNPHRHRSLYPFRDLAGVGVTFKLAQAVCDLQGLGQDVLEEDCLALVALGTVADCVPIVGENRSLVTQGLQEMERTYLPGVRELVRAAGIRQVDTEAIAFYLAPILSCRLCEPSSALQLLLETEPVRARAFATYLKAMNDERKRMQHQLEEEAFRSISEDRLQYPFMFVAGENWHHRLIGLLAAKLTAEFGRPAFAVSVDKDEYVLRGSCRSIEGVDVLQALAACGDLLKGYGGHRQAAGFQLYKSNLELFQETLFQYFKAYNLTAGAAALDIDAEMPLSEINLHTYEQLGKLSPFGEANPRPTLVTPKLVVASAVAFGASGNHLRMVLTDGEKSKCVPAIWWRGAGRIDECQPGLRINVAYELVLDSYHRSPRVMMNVQDVCP